MNTKPMEIEAEEWEEILRMPEVRDAWGLTSLDTPESFSSSVYGVKFSFTSESPGYWGKLYLLHSGTLGNPVLRLIRNGKWGPLETI